MEPHVLHSKSRKIAGFSPEKRALPPSPTFIEAVMDTLKADCTRAVKEKRFVHLPPGASGVVDFKLLVDDNDNILAIDKGILEEHRSSTDFRYPSCLHSYLTGTYCESIICYRSSVLASGCTKSRKEWCGYFVPVCTLLGVGSQVQTQRYQRTYLGPLSSMSALSPASPEKSASASAEMAAAQLSPSPLLSLSTMQSASPPYHHTPPHGGMSTSARMNILALATPSSNRLLLEPPPSQPGTSKLSLGKRPALTERESPNTSPILSLLGCVHGAIQLEPDSLEMLDESPAKKRTKRTLFFASSTKPIRRTHREIELRESTSTGTSSLTQQVFTAFCTARFLKAVYKEQHSGYQLSWATSLHSEGMPESEVMILIRYCQACNTFIRCDKVKAHLACNCPPNINIEDNGSFKELWECLRIAGLNADRLGLLFQGCSVCLRYVAHEYRGAHALHCLGPAQAPLEVIEVDSDSD
ncbi:hypothetical protein BT96DRAFT_1007099 [Gymnopus androsaceus JB14]|uniref:Uncharacterized protein n=1 Tax=Gymnopus androsaceus JB14 TaxID=1447944 RepID=A0A6A4GI69_9AGAR|nr:hypothetical protein BT96DRAFT_1007099 [Gymnopus androsaceus JB14]